MELPAPTPSVDPAVAALEQKIAELSPAHLEPAFFAKPVDPAFVPLANLLAAADAPAPDLPPLQLERPGTGQRPGTGRERPGTGRERPSTGQPRARKTPLRRPGSGFPRERANLPPTAYRRPVTSHGALRSKGVSAKTVLRERNTAMLLAASRKDEFAMVTKFAFA